MRSIYDQEMREIQRDSIHMCNLAAETLQDVMDAVRRRDFNVVDRVLEQDYTLRQMRMAINERVMRMIATQHPVAVDLRKLFYLVHTADEMERIGYQAAGIGRAMMREQYGKVPLLDDIFRMSERVGHYARARAHLFAGRGCRGHEGRAANGRRGGRDLRADLPRVHRPPGRASGAGQRDNDRHQHCAVPRTRRRPCGQLGAVVALFQRGAGRNRRRDRLGEKKREGRIHASFFLPLGKMWEERRGRGKGVAVRVEAARFAAQGEGSAQEGEPPSWPVCAEMTLRVQGSPKSSRGMLERSEGGGMKVL